MDATEQATYAAHAFGRGIAEGWRGTARAPLLALLAARLGLMAMLAWFAFPLWSPIAAPLMARTGGEQALHFPGAMRVLPLVHGRIATVMDLVLAPLVAALACAGVARRLPSPEPRADPARRVIFAALVIAPVLGVIGAIGEITRGAAAGLSSSFVRAVTQLAGATVVSSVLVALLLPLLGLAVLGHPRTESRWDAWRWAWKRSGMAFVALGIAVTMAQVVVTIALARAVPVLAALAPEWVALGLAMDVVMRTTLQWGLACAAAMLWIGLVEDPWG